MGPFWNHHNKHGPFKERPGTGPKLTTQPHELEPAIASYEVNPVQVWEVLLLIRVRLDLRMEGVSI